jgi:exodeoxyribonuclease V alpha subunit
MTKTVDELKNVETLDGVVERIVFHNPQNGWTVLRLQDDRSPLLKTVVGKLQQLSPGEKVRVTGSWTVDPKHGRQFAAETCVPLAPATVMGIEKYLGSGLVPGLGPVMAGRIVAKFGIDTLEVLKGQPERLAEVDGIGPKRAKAITGAVIAKEALQSVMVFLESAGISPAFAHRIYQRFENDAIRVVTENPFRLASEIAGIGFKSADKIAKTLGIPKDAMPRAEAGLLYVLEELSQEGHVFAPRQALLDRAGELLSIDQPLLVNALDRLILMGKVRRRGSDEEAPCYLTRLFLAEEGAAKVLSEYIDLPTGHLEIDVTAAIARFEADAGIRLAREQRAAFVALKQARVTVLTGGPGTGKTTLLNGLVACLETIGLKVAMAAPTGRAARRMAEATHHDAKTIHRLLEFNPKTGRFERRREKPIEADVLVVDEVSMVDIELFWALLSALPPTSRLILVGDPNQLPSVGPGTVLADLLRLSRRFECLASVHLNEIFRQARSSLIITGAHQILNGQEPATGEKGEAADLFLVERDSPESCLDTLKTLISSRIPSRFGFNPVDDIQVLTPMHKGLLGATNLNVELQELLNPVHGRAEAPGRFRIGDKVMQVKNNYDLEVFNGDIGRVTAAEDEQAWVEVTFEERKVRCPASEFHQLTLAYACSIHKSQGSEYPAVIIPLHTQHFVMLKRNLLYTAITRGKKLVVIVGTRRAVGLAVRNDDQLTRHSGLIDQVAELLKRRG